ncbi:uncharacterized protein LOC132716574 isoform X1 [Ruditapes philippinarum]|uniref:uncharacterized protein LOC132716574 isoform X1 n=1 Tax=Ruditapes philippinarum TaxID=129788 RepID=UPI00295C2042|nr:uncharacterized protein LOC132716574 isoform X1 [Ruditapes philippinarum]
MGGVDGQLQIDTKLHEAVRFSQIEDVRIALQQGYDPNLIGVYMWSPLHEAAYNGDKEILKLLLQRKGDPNKKDYQRGRTATHYAAENGHIECLKLLINAGARYDIRDEDDKDCLDVVTPGGRKILERLKMKDLMLNPDDDKDEGISTDRSHDLTSLSSSRRSSVISEQEDGPVLGHIHLSVEYHAAKGSLKIRVWQLSDLLLPPPNTSMIHSIYVKSYLQPDKKRETKRKTEEVKVDSSKGSIHWKKKKDISVKHVFTPANFKFSQPLEYSGITHDVVKEKQLEIEVCVTQRYSHRSFLIGMIRMSLKSAVKKLKRERLVIIPCMNHTIPSSMKVYCASELDIVNNSPGGNYFFSSPNVRIVLPEDTDDSSEKAASNPDLQPWKHHSPSVEVDMNQKFEFVPNVPKLDLNITPLDESGYSSEFHVSLQGELESPDSDSYKNSFVRLHEKSVGIPKVHDPLRKMKPVQVLENIKEHNLRNTETNLVGKSDVKLEITDFDDTDLGEVLVESGKKSNKEVEESKKQTTKCGKKSDKDSGSRPETPTWDYYDIPTEVVSQEVEQSITPWKEGAAPVVLPMETTLGLANTKDQNVRQLNKSDKSVRHSKKKSNKPIPGKAVPLIPSIVVTNAEQCRETKIAIPSEILREVKDNDVNNSEEIKISVDSDKGARPKTKSLLKKVDRKMFINVGKTISKDRKGNSEVEMSENNEQRNNEHNRPKSKPKLRKLKKSQEMDSKGVYNDNEEFKKVKVPPLDFSGKNTEPVQTGSYQQTGTSVVLDMDKLSLSAASAHVVEVIEDDISITELDEGDQLFTDRSEVSVSAFTDIESGLGDYHIPERVSPTKYMIPMQVYDVDDTSCDESIATDRSYVPTTVL